MKNISNKKIKRIWLKYVSITIIGVVLLVLSLVFFFLMKRQDKIDNDNIRNLSYYTENRNAKPDGKVYLNVSYILDNFAHMIETTEYNHVKVSSKVTEYYHLVIDENNIGYIVSLDKTEEERFLNLSEGDSPVYVVGAAKKIPDDIKKYAIEFLNYYDSSLEYDEVKFDEYFGSVYLNQSDKHGETAGTYMALSIFCVMFAATALFVGVPKVRSIKLTMKKFDDNELQKIDNELNNVGENYYKNICLYLLQDYAVLLNNTVKIIKYSEILWMYITERNSVLSLQILTEDGNTSALSSRAFSKRLTQDTCSDICNKLTAKNKNIALGYTKENVLKYKNYKKRKK